MSDFKLDIVFENGNYKVTVNGDLEYNQRDFAKVQEMFDVDMSYHFAEAVRLTFMNHGEVIDRSKQSELPDGF